MDEIAFVVRLHGKVEGKLTLTRKTISFSPTKSKTLEDHHDGASPASDYAFSYKWTKIEKLHVSTKPDGAPKMRLLFRPKEVNGEIKTRNPIFVTTLDAKTMDLLRQEVSTHLRAGKEKVVEYKEDTKKKVKKPKKARSSADRGDKTLQLVDKGVASFAPVRNPIPSSPPIQIAKKSVKKEGNRPGQVDSLAPAINKTNNQKTKGRNEQCGVVGQRYQLDNEHAQECVGTRAIPGCSERSGSSSGSKLDTHDALSNMEEGQPSTRRKPTKAGETPPRQQSHRCINQKVTETTIVCAMVMNILYMAMAFIALALIAIDIILASSEFPDILILPCVLAMIFSGLAILGATYKIRWALWVALIFYVVCFIGSIVYVNAIGISVHLVLFVTHAFLLYQLG